MGALKKLALDEGGEASGLPTIDVFSAVSGGSYTLSWYFYQHWYRATHGHAPPTAKSLFGNDSAAQQYLKENAALIPYRWTAVPTAIATTAATIPANVVLNGLFGWHANVSPSQKYYQNGLERTFHAVTTVPHAKGQGAENAKSHPKPSAQNLDPSLLFASFGVHRSDRLSWPGLNKFLHSAPGQRLPYPVVVASADISPDYTGTGQRHSDRLFEFTPQRMGSQYYGYTEYTEEQEKELDVHRAVAISGAAYDSAAVIRGSSTETLASIANFELGFFIRNYRSQRGLSQQVSEIGKVLEATYPLHPFPIYFLTGWVKDQDGVAILLTDGGHAENTGILSLARRGCSQIIVIDSEPDPGYEFANYAVARQALEAT